MDSSKYPAIEKLCGEAVRAAEGGRPPCLNSIFEAILEITIAVDRIKVLEYERELMLDNLSGRCQYCACARPHKYDNFETIMTCDHNESPHRGYRHCEHWKLRGAMLPSVKEDQHAPVQNRLVGRGPQAQSPDAEHAHR